MPLGHHGHGENRRLSLSKGSKGSADESRGDGEGGDETVVEPDQGNVLSHIISQLRPGADLSRVTLPTFILEPKSMLERITNFMAHPETLLPMPEIDDPVQRFLSVVKFYLSGWHIKPPGVKKPLNPILGETFTCYWDYPDHTRGYYISEQTSHHPPKSSYFFMVPEHNIRIDGDLKPRSKFLGNSAASMMEGIAVLRFMNRGARKGPQGGERYFVTQPNMYARGILFGKMKYELGDHSFVRCPENNLVADVEFKTKGYFGGTYNAIGGAIKNDKTGEILYELSGMWSGEMVAKNMQTGQKEVLFDATHARHTPPIVRPIAEQEERESQRLWEPTVIAIKKSDHTAATDEKSKIEDRQRDETAKRAEQGIEWQPRYFRKIRGGPGGSEEGEEDLDWILDAEIDAPTPQGKAEQILAIAPIMQGQASSKPPNSQQQQQAPATQAQAFTGDGNAPPQTSQSLPQQDKLQAQPHIQNQAPPPQIGGDLIDFGNGNQLHTPTQQAPIRQPSPYQATGGAPPGLQEPLMPGHPIQRVDTVTKDVDEFVDAPSRG